MNVASILAGLKKLSKELFCDKCKEKTERFIQEINVIVSNANIKDSVKEE